MFEFFFSCRFDDCGGGDGGCCGYGLVVWCLIFFSLWVWLCLVVVVVVVVVAVADGRGGCGWYWVFFW